MKSIILAVCLLVSWSAMADQYCYYSRDGILICSGSDGSWGHGS